MMVCDLRVLGAGGATRGGIEWRVLSFALLRHPRSLAAAAI